MLYKLNLFLLAYDAYCLDLKYTVFAKVIDGWDTLDALERLPVNPKNYKPEQGKKKQFKC